MSAAFRRWNVWRRSWRCSRGALQVGRRQLSRILALDLDVHQGGGPDTLTAPRRDIFRLSSMRRRNFPPVRPDLHWVLGYLTQREMRAMLKLLPDRCPRSSTISMPMRRISWAVVERRWPGKPRPLRSHRSETTGHPLGEARLMAVMARIRVALASRHARTILALSATVDAD